MKVRDVTMSRTFSGGQQSGGRGRLAVSNGVGMIASSPIMHVAKSNNGNQQQKVANGATITVATQGLQIGNGL